MKNNIKPIFLKIFTLAAALLGYLLRYLLYATAIDRKGLLLPGHWATWSLVVLTVLFLGALFLLARNPKTPMRYEESFPSSFLRGWGCWIAAAAILFRSYQNIGTSDQLNNLSAIVGFAAVIGLVVVGVFRFMGRQPNFLCHTAVSIYFALLTVSQYQDWSSTPQLMNYAFYLGAFVCLMLTAYFLTQFHVNPQSHRGLWFAAMAAVYFCIVALPDSGDGIFLQACTLWALTCTPRMEVKLRRSAIRAKKEG